MQLSSWRLPDDASSKFIRTAIFAFMTAHVPRTRRRVINASRPGSDFANQRSMFFDSTVSEPHHHTL